MRQSERVRGRNYTREERVGEKRERERNEGDSHLHSSTNLIHGAVDSNDSGALPSPVNKFDK